MMTSENFRAQHEILFSAPILRGAKATCDFSFGWSNPTETSPLDVIDLNRNGQVDFNSPSGDEVQRFDIQEPGFAGPGYGALKAYGVRTGCEVLTPEELRSGLFFEKVSLEHHEAERYSETDRSSPDGIADYRVSENIYPAELEVHRNLDEFDPSARYAIDLARDEFLIFR